ncbi:hypothetical protein J3D46_004868 [Paenarthrobacter sp. A20]|nr:hypothetical protein [Paenarthrobacter sp. A20]
MILIYLAFMVGLTAIGVVLTIAAQTNLQLAGGLLALTLGAGGVSAGAVSSSADRRTRRTNQGRSPAAHEGP